MLHLCLVNKKSVVCLFGLGLALWGMATPATAVSVRIATWNVLHGVDTDHDHLTNLNDDYSAVTAIVAREQQDLICFQ